MHMHIYMHAQPHASMNTHAFMYMNAYMHACITHIITCARTHMIHVIYLIRIFVVDGTLKAKNYRLLTLIVSYTILATLPLK